MNKNIEIDKMTELGVHIGHKKNNYHPKIKKYLSQKRDGIHIFNLNKTQEELDKALTFIKGVLGNNNQVILFVGTKVQLKELIKESAEKIGMPYVNTKWPGGFFTNFKIIKKRMDYFIKLENDLKEGKYKDLTKKEQLRIEKELIKLRTKFNGVRGLTKLPEAIFISDINKNKSVLKEARQAGIKIVAITDTNTNPELVDYPIPASDDSISSVKYILTKIIELKK